MKTRVVRYWGGTDWLYRVETHEQVKESDVFVTIGGQNFEYLPKPEVGSWRWIPYILPNGGASGIHSFSRDRAMSIASRLALDLPQEDADVIAEFGD